MIPYSQTNQTMAAEPSKSETQLLDNAMDVDPLSDSITHINLSGILNKSIQLQPEAQTETPVDERLALTVSQPTSSKWEENDWGRHSPS